MKRREPASIARIDRMFSSVPGLFSSLERGQRTKQKLNIRHDFPRGRSIEFKGHEPLDALDLRVLQILVAMAAQPELTTNIPDTVRMKLHTGLQLQGHPGETITVRCTHRHFARERGYKDGYKLNFVRLRASIERLSTVTVFFDDAGRRTACHLISSAHSSEHDRNIFACLNPRLARAVLGVRSGEFTRINLNEARSLSDRALLVHQRLCAWINAGSTGSILLDKVCGYIWAAPALTPAAERKRRVRARSALAEIGKLPGWSVVANTKDNRFTISRP